MSPPQGPTVVVSIALTRIVLLVVVASATAGQLAYLDALTRGIFTPGTASGIDVLSTVVTMAAAHALGRLLDQSPGVGIGDFESG